MPVLAEILSTHTPALFTAAVARAVALLRAGDLVALPTETVYGLAANAFNADAVQRIFIAKGRPATNPIIVHVASSELARRCVSAWPTLADKLAAAFWPGPLTLVLPRSDRIPDVVTSGGPTVGVRWPSHPFITAVIEACDFPLAAPSANLSNQVSPTTAEHVRHDLGDRIPLIVDGGPSAVGIESTVLDISCQPPRLLRPGMIHAESLLAVTRKLASGDPQPDGILRSPGLLKKHYAPKARLLVCAWRDANELAALLEQNHLSAAQTHIIAYSQIPGGAGFGRVSVMAHDPTAYARALYAELHRCDAEGARWIIIEALPSTPAWQGIIDRLSRAASSH